MKQDCLYLHVNNLVTVCLLIVIQCNVDLAKDVKVTLVTLYFVVVNEDACARRHPPLPGL